MVRRITETFHGFNMPEVWIEVEGVEYHGELRAWAVDDYPDSNEGDEWWAMCNWHCTRSETRIDWFPAGRVRRVADLDDEDGQVFSNVVALPQRDA